MMNSDLLVFFLQIRDHCCDRIPRSASAGALERGTSPDADRGSVPARLQTSPYTLVARSPDAIANNINYGSSKPINALTSLPPPPAQPLLTLQQEPPVPFSRFFSQFFGTPAATTVTRIPTTITTTTTTTNAANPSTSSASKDAVLDLSNPVPNKQEQFLPMPAIPQQCKKLIILNFFNELYFFLLYQLSCDNDCQFCSHQAAIQLWSLCGSNITSWCSSGSISERWYVFSTVAEQR